MTGTQVHMFTPVAWRGVRKLLTRLKARPRHTNLRGKR